MVQLPTLSSEITEAVRAAETHAGAAVAAARRAGTLLLEAKALLPHGQWEGWVSENCSGLALRTAQAYMRLAAKLQALPPAEAQRVADLPLRDAFAAITTPGTAPPRAETYRPNSADSFKARSTFEAASRSLRRVCLDVGLRNLTRDRLKSLRGRLQAVQEELDRMLSDVRQ